jgi:hypothetical protein
MQGDAPAGNATPTDIMRIIQRAPLRSPQQEKKAA